MSEASARPREADRAPCIECARAPRCAAEKLACSAFAGFATGRPYWHILPRVDATHERYELVMAVPVRLPRRVAAVLSDHQEVDGGL